MYRLGNLGLRFTETMTGVLLRKWMRIEVLGGSWVVISGVISRVTIVITPFITAHEPPSSQALIADFAVSKRFHVYCAISAAINITTVLRAAFIIPLWELQDKRHPNVRLWP